MPRACSRTPERREARGRAWRAVAAAAVLALVAGGAVAGGAEPAHAASGQLRGHVFLDFDGDGVFDTGNSATSGIANDRAHAGVVVRAYDRNNVLVGTATSAASGNPNYTLVLNAGVTDGDPLRVEFALPAGTYDSFRGTNSNTSVRFVAAGAENVDLGIARPDDFNSNNPYIATVLQRAGDPTMPANTGEPAVVLNRWSVANNATTTQVESPNCSQSPPQNCADFSARKVVATMGQVGAVYSASFDAQGRDLYVAATYKRGAGLGSLGLGGIYRINDVVDAAGNLTAGTPSVTPWVNVAAAAGLNINVGTAQTNAQRLLNNSQGVFADPHGFASATKIGIGGMVIDSDARILYFVNLFDKRIYAISLAATPTLIGSWATPATSGQQPFALSLRGGDLYVGYNDTGEAAPFCPASAPKFEYTGGATGGCTNASPAASPLQARIARAPLSATGVPGAWTTVLTIPLSYAKGNEIYDWQGTGGTVASANQQTLRWNTWTNTWTNTRGGTTRSVAFETTGGWGVNWLHVYPQPYVASLAFDASGFMTVGLGDRTQTQSGNRQVAANETAPTTSTRTYETLSSGDTLLAAPNTNGTFTLESNGTATGTAGTRAGATGRDTQPVNLEGPGGNEFYYDRGNLGTQVIHREASLGAVTIAPGVAQVASTFIDPLGPMRVSGLGWFDANNGNMVRGFQQSNDTGGGSFSSSFQKGGGIGGLTLVLRDAPVEIGNRVWYDADLDGVQDADEPAINGAPVELWAADGSGNPVGTTPIATTTTATVGGQAGTWYFRSEDSPTGGTANFVKNADYVVVFPAGSGAVDLVWPSGAAPPGFSGINWAQLQRTAASVAGSTTLNDSNPNPTTGYAPIRVGGGSENDHTIDAGWYGMSTYRLEKLVVGTAPPGATYTIEVTAATDFRGAARLGSGGAASDPMVDTLSYELTAGQTLTTVERIPYGHTLTFAEADMPSEAVAFAPQVPGDDDHGRILIAPTVEAGGVKVTATNSLGAIAVTKLLSTAADIPDDTTFPIEYTIDGGPVQTAELAVGPSETLTIDGIPWGSEVKIREPLEGPFSWGGYVWVSPSWSQGATALVPDLEGWVTVDGFDSTSPVELTLTNRPLEVPGLPFTGGLGADIFTIGGSIVMLLGAALGIHQFAARRTRRSPAHRA